CANFRRRRPLKSHRAWVHRYRDRLGRRGYRKEPGAAGDGVSVGRWVFAVAASAALCAQAGSPARADEPKARIEGDIDRQLREAITRVIGETDTPPQNRFEARRRARDAASDVIA